MQEASGKKILIVDDDPDIVDSIKIVLEQEGYATASAASSEEGLEKVRSERPDLIVLDVMMPEGTEGFHFVWALRKDADATLRDLPIIMLTSVHQTGPERFYPEQTDGTYEPHEYLPVQAFLDKPVPLEKLIAEVKRLLDSEEGSA
jgi:CheY-like chemotaxis protein